MIFADGFAPRENGVEQRLEFHQAARLRKVVTGTVTHRLDSGFQRFFFCFIPSLQLILLFLSTRTNTTQPYFFSQDPDYITVKERVSAFAATGKEATGVATIDIAVETLRIAEYLTPTIKEQLA